MTQKVMPDINVKHAEVDVYALCDSETGKMLYGFSSDFDHLDQYRSERCDGRGTIWAYPVTILDHPEEVSETNYGPDSEP